VVANASQLPPGAVSISVVGGNLGRRLAATTGTVTLELSMSSDDSQVGAAALSLSSLSSNTPFLSQDKGKYGEAGEMKGCQWWLVGFLGKKMVKWGFQGVYVGMLLVMILCWGSMFHPWF